tara:strand:+ start:1017 stop:1208 length:192 start_codon:yes stop_codon:yes gene_type:complete
MNYLDLKKNYRKWIRYHERNGGGFRRTNSSNRLEGTNRSIASFVVTTATSEGISSFELANKKL